MLIIRAVAPLAIRVAGYYPGSRLRMLGDLPPNVMRQWGRWCLDPAYLGVSRVGHHGFFRSAHRDLWSAHVLPALAHR